jgi:ABC-2 type transport system permease protein
MRNVAILFRRELLAYFCSPIAYIVGVCVLGLTGISFNMIVTILTEGPSDYTPLMWFFNGMFTWIILLVVPPVITMRLFADEKRTGTIEALMTAPLRDAEYVAAKFLSGLFFFCLIWLPTLAYVWVLRHFSHDKTPLDIGPVAGGYLGLFMMGMLLVAIGCMASASTRNQIIAAVISFAMSCGLFFAGIYFYLNAAGQSREFFESFSILAHMQERSRGVVEWKRIVFYFTSTGFFLFVTHRIVQSRQWKT